MLRTLIAVLVALGSTTAFGQFTILDDYNSNPGSYAVDEDAQGPADEPRKWRVIVGAGLVDAPRFAGSNRMRAGVVPLVQAHYGSFFAGIGGVGLNVYRDSNWRLAASVSPSRGRKESDDSRLQGLGDIESTIKGRLIASYRRDAFVVRAEVGSDLAGRHQGTVARADVFGVFRPAERLVVFAGPGVSWADKQYTQSYFGVTAVQSANSGFPQFDAGSGTNSVRFSVGSLYRFDRHWFGVATWSASRLQGDAASSPIIQTRTQNQFLAAAAYLF
jgi:outer membrane protein